METNNQFLIAFAVIGITTVIILALIGLKATFEACIESSKFPKFLKPKGN
jgi:hypothetical protein